MFPATTWEETRPMVISEHENVVCLSGVLEKNLWTTVKAVANMLLQRYPQEVIIDCAGLESITGSGTAMFQEAVNDIATTMMLIRFANLPQTMRVELQAIIKGDILSQMTGSVERTEASSADVSIDEWERNYGQILSWLYGITPFGLRP
jgi:hypothetical protein